MFGTFAFGQGAFGQGGLRSKFRVTIGQAVGAATVIGIGDAPYTQSTTGQAIGIANVIGIGVQDFHVFIRLRASSRSQIELQAQHITIDSLKARWSPDHKLKGTL